MSSHPADQEEDVQDAQGGGLRRAGPAWVVGKWHGTHYKHVHKLLQNFKNDTINI